MIRNEQTLRDPTRVIIPLKMFILTPWQHVDLAFTWRLFVQSLKYNFFPLIFFVYLQALLLPLSGHTHLMLCMPSMGKVLKKEKNVQPYKKLKGLLSVAQTCLE